MEEGVEQLEKFDCMASDVAPTLPWPDEVLALQKMLMETSSHPHPFHLWPIRLPGPPIGVRGDAAG